MAHRIGPKNLSQCNCTDLDSKIALAVRRPLREFGVRFEVDYG